jgi:hypothetical protein
MKIQGKHADLIRRLKLYGFGFLLGILVVSFVYKGKGCQTPGTSKKEELTWQKLEYSTQAECFMKCRNITKTELNQVLKSGKVNFDESKVREKPYGIYAIEGATATNKKIRILIADCDTISKVVNAIDLNHEVNNCDCK